MRAALDPFHFDLRILAGLGLNPVVLVGLLDARDADRQSQRILEWLLEDEVSARTIGSGPDLPAAIREAVRETSSKTPSPSYRWTRPRNSTSKTAFACCTAWPRPGNPKMMFLSTSAGLERDGAPRVSLVNLLTDYERLLNSRPIPPARLPAPAREDLLDRLPQRMSVAVVNPLQLLRELFTVSGAGTLIRKGSRIENCAGLATVDRVRGSPSSRVGVRATLVPASDGRSAVWSVAIRARLSGRGLSRRRIGLRTTPWRPT